MPFHLNERDAPSRPLTSGRGRSIRLIDATTGSERIDLHISVMAPGSGPGTYHYHSAAEVAYLVLAGHARVIVEGAVIDAGPGECIWIPPGDRHGVENVGGGELRLLEVKSPAVSDSITAA